MVRVRAALIAGVLVLSGPAGAATCEESLSEFASEYGFTTTLVKPRDDQTAPLSPLDNGSPVERGSLPLGDLGRTGGVITPPHTDDHSVIEPPPTASRMPTAPPVSPGETAPMPDQPSTIPQIGPGTRVQAQAILDQALAAARDGDDERCFERLGAARELVHGATQGKRG